MTKDLRTQCLYSEYVVDGVGDDLVVVPPAEQGVPVLVLAALVVVVSQPEVELVPLRLDRAEED